MPTIERTKEEPAGLSAIEPRGLKCTDDQMKKLRADWLRHYPEMSAYLAQKETD